MICPYCNSNASLKDSSIIYGKSFGNVWICGNYPECDAYVGVHKSDNKTPLGRMADKELREWKKKAHAKFDPLWKSKKMNRHEAYKYMQYLMGLTEDEAHIGMFNVDQCKKLIEKLS